MHPFEKNDGWVPLRFVFLILCDESSVLPVGCRLELYQGEDKTRTEGGRIF